MVSEVAGSKMSPLDKASHTQILLDDDDECPYQHCGVNIRRCVHATEEGDANTYFERLRS